MPVFHVTSPDGKTYEVNGPDGSTQDQAIQYVRNNLDKIKPLQATQPAQQAQPQEKGIADYVGDYLKQQAQTLGNAGAGLLRGAGSIGSTLMIPSDAVVSIAQGKMPTLDKFRARNEDMDYGLEAMGAQPQSMTYKVGKVGGEMAGTAGAGGLVANGIARALPASIESAPLVARLLTALRTSGASTGANMAGANVAQKAGDLALRGAGGAASGATTALMTNPEDLKTGAVTGAVMPVGLSALANAGGAGKKVLRATLGISPETASLAQKAMNQYGIPLGIGDIAQNPLVKAAQSVGRDIPLAGRIADKHAEGMQQAFNDAIAQKAGIPNTAGKIFATDTAAGKAAFNDKYNKIWSNNNLNIDTEFAGRLNEIMKSAEKLPQSAGASLKAEVNDLLSKVQFGPNGEAFIPGDIANKFQSHIRTRAEGSSELKGELSSLRQSIIDAFNRGVSPEDAALLAKTQGEYKAFKTISPLLNKGEAGVAGREVGDVAPALLPGAVANNYANVAGTPLADLSKIGSKFLVNRTPQTGGGARAAIQNGILGGIVASQLGVPGIVASLPTAGVVNTALSNNKLAQMLLDQSKNKLLSNQDLQQFIAKAGTNAVTQKGNKK